ncbi:MAG: acyltransferase family protein [Holdemanella sp.]|uniref:acyltransferase family protein n=1 Tax=Holdemanella sp. TaxID=1971762 RepID=UPI002E77D579|nr:acyltransferase family protein [Holdemanella sp.]MEE0079826.1 acyltransferase family protein [Holdemanella sp.]
MKNNVQDVVEGTLENRQAGISLDCSNCLKGIFAICVLIHHLYQHSGLLHQTIIGGCLQAAGYLSVSCFFFLSGYGLYVSYMSKGETYINGFLKRKIAPFYCLILFFTVIYFVEGILTGQTFSAGIMLKSVTFGGTIIGNGWYLQVQLLLYLFFLETFRIVKDGRLRILFIFGEYLLFCTCLYALGYSSTWFESVLAFPVGMMWREKDHRMANVNCNTSFYVMGG